MELIEAGIYITDAGVNLFLTAVIAFYAMLLTCGVNYTAAGAYTREGRNFYINKYIPVSPALILKAKLRLADIVTIVAIVLTLGVTAVSGLIPIGNCLLMGVELALMGFGLNGMAIRRDLRRPKLEWNNVNEAFKNNFYMSVPMFVAMIIGFAILISSILIITLITDALWSQICFWLLTLTISSVMFAIYRSDVTKGASKMMESIE